MTIVTYPLLMMLLTAPQTATSRPADSAPPATGILFKTITLDGEASAYCVYVPLEYDPEKPWPVILFLCGSGDTGTDGLRTTDNGIGRSLRWNRQRIPAVVVFPQCPTNATWTGKYATLAIRCLEQTSREYNLDPDRVYLTGLSLGGQGTWYIGARYAKHFAALVPVCGFVEGLEKPPADDILKNTAAAVSGVPIWCFHGGLDRTVPTQRAREIVQAVKAAGGKVQYTEYADLGHNVWDRAYEDPKLWEWLFAQKRSATQPVTRPGGG